MIDLLLLRENPDEIIKLILNKDPKFDINKLIKLDKKVRSLKNEIENLRKIKNDISREAKKGITEELRNKSIDISKKLKTKEKEYLVINKEFQNLLLSCPNIPKKDIPLGNKESNLTVEIFGDKPTFTFKPKNHLELNEKLNWFDFNASNKMSGANFVLYKNDAVKLVYALTHLMLKNNVSFGFNPIIPPYLVKKSSLVNSGNLPKFKDEIYETQDDLSLIPTAEVNLTNMYANEILNKDNLPIRMAAWTSCFRREAGGYGSNDRGLIRIHQFEKVELYSIVEPDKSDEELSYMIKTAKNILDKLGLHYRITKLAAQDCSFSSAKTFDIEVWMPGQNRYYEVSSASNCTDFQARRAKIRYRENPTSKPKLVNTLNASSLALPRLIVALMETYQQPDGTIKFPKILQEAMDYWW